MNRLENKSASDYRFCSPTELIGPTKSLTARRQTAPTNGNGNLQTILPDVPVVLAKRPACDNGDGAARLGNNGSESARRIEQCIAYMREHLDRPLPVAKLAAVANVSPSHFFALFKRQTGCAPMDYFTRLRMQQARRLLDATPASVKEVAAALGYEDPFYFSRVFKSVNRVPPSEYRMLQKRPRDPGVKPLNSAALPASKSPNNGTVYSIKENLCYLGSTTSATRSFYRISSP